MRFLSPFSSFVFFSPLFWGTVWWGVIADWVSKWFINQFIDPLNTPVRSLTELEGKVYPFPPGRFSITHVEHRQEGWPDLDGNVAISWLTEHLDELVDKTIPFDVPIGVSFVVVVAAIPVWIGLSTIGKKTMPWTVAVALGFWVAGGIGNETEIALFSHATDWIWIRLWGLNVVANLADLMLFAAVLLLILPRRDKEPDVQAEASGDSDTA